MTKTYELAIRERSSNPKYQAPRKEKFLVLLVNDSEVADIRISELAKALDKPED